jgi:hypothetical protein
VAVGGQVAPHGREDLGFLVLDVLVEHVAQPADRRVQLSERAWARADGRGHPARLAGCGTDGLVVIGQRSQVYGRPRGCGDHRPHDAVLVVKVRTDLGQQRRGVAADGVRPRRWHISRRDPAQAGGEPAQVLADGPVGHPHGNEVRLLPGIHPGCGWRCGGHIPSLGRPSGG